MTNPDHTGTPAATEYATVHLVFELSKATWKLGLLLPGSKKLSRYAIPAGDLKGADGAADEGAHEGGGLRQTGSHHFLL